MSTAAARRAYSGPPIFSFGFRPFFLMAAVWSALTVPLWVWSWLGGPPEFAHRDWHVHEMLFGVLAAIVAGFLTTAVPNWTGRMPVMGSPLAALVALWLAGRAAMLFSDQLGPAAAAIDSLFLVAFAAVVWREILAGRNWRNLPVCGLVSLLAIANLSFHIDAALWRSGAGERLALGAIAVLLALIGGRITPSFTRNWMRARRLSPEPAASGRFDQAVLALTCAAVLAWVLLPEGRPSGLLLLLAGLANLARLARWRGWAAAREPLVWILHLGYGWLGIGLLLLGASRLTEWAPPSAGLHALGAGAAGVMTLAVMTRASRGHTGRALASDGATLAIYLAVNAAAVIRVGGAFAIESQALLIAASALLWAGAFGGFALAYAPMLLTSRRVQA